jgi:class 3 adenylate cyclase
MLSLLENREPEVRPITVMFCDLVGSTELSERLDPEDLRALIDAYRKVSGAAVNRYEGQVANYAGDGLMAFFGWPRAHEDDAVRAVHAALAILSEVTNVPGAVKLTSRVGICSGRVVVGQTGGPGGWMEAVGETPNIAARLQTLAAPNTLLISESTQRLASAAFEFQDLGFRELKGVTKPLRVYGVLSAKHTATRFEAAHASSLTPLVGRSTELNLLLDHWQKTKEGGGQVVLLSGIPGVGKSRLIHELKSNIQKEPFLLNYQCSPYHSQSALFPVIEQMELAEEPNHELTHKRAAEGDEGEIPTVNFGDALDQVTKTSTGEIDSLIGEFQRLQRKLQTDGERVKREIEEYRTLSELVIQLTKGISENVEKVRGLADR